MHILGLLLILINVGAVAGPLAGVAIVYRDNPVEMIIPPEVEEVLTSTINTNKPVELPKYVSSAYDIATKTVTATFSFTNPFKVDLKVNSLSADVECANHVFALGHAELDNPVQINEGATAMISVVFIWTQEGENHFVTAHAEAASIDVNLINLGVDVSGITIETPETMRVNVPLLQ